MAIRDILTVPDPRLKEVSLPVEGGVTDEHRALMDDMLETMYDAPGIGLAAIQVGVPLRIIVMDLTRAISSIRKSLTRLKRLSPMKKAACLSLKYLTRLSARPNAVSAISIMRVSRLRKKPKACSPSAFNTRWTILKARCLSTTSPA